jgi:hypothetical protein
MARQAVPIARQAVPLAKQAVPMAKQAGIAARQSAEDAVAWATPHVEDAVAWATPHVDDARSWAAPRIERTGIAVRDSIAPRISDALVTAAHRLDTTPARRRRWPKLLAGLALLAAIASAGAAVARWRRPDPFAYEPSSPAAADNPASPAADEPDRTADANGSQAEAEVNGQFLTS